MFTPAKIVLRWFGMLPEETEVERAACKGESKIRSLNQQSKRKQKVEDDWEKDLIDDRDVIMEDDSFDKKTLESVSLELRKIYNEVEKELKKKVDEELQNDFLQKLKTMEPLARENAGPPMNERPTIVVQRNTSKNCLIKTTNDCVEYPEEEDVHCVVVEAGDVLPPMPYWVHIESNIKAEDDMRLSHVPYLNEHQDDDRLCDALITLFEDGIHGYSDNWKYINDWMVYKILGKIFETNKFDRDYVFYAFYQLFPNKYSYRQLPDVFDELCEKWGEGFRRVADIDQPLPYDPLDSKQNLHTTRAMDCIQCRTYDCSTHGFVPNVPSKFNFGSWISKKLPLPPKGAKKKDKCSDDCWKSINRQTILNKLNREDDDAKCDKIDIWFDKCELLRSMKSADVQATSFVLQYSLSKTAQENFCIFSQRVIELEFNEELTCKKVYETLLELCRTPSNVRLFADREKVKVDPSQMHKNFRNSTWSSGIGKIQNQYRMDPCHHEGTCGPNNKECVCLKNGVCTKFCSCDDTCKMKFPGCRCAPGQCRTKQCQCFYAKWECDPTLCKSCQCDSLVYSKNLCRNSAISKGLQKKLKVFPSQVAGWGAFLMEPAEKGELISEYTGEIISSSEVERRGHIYDKFKTSYIFALSEDECVDAQKMGNLIRFANHSENHANCYSQILIVNGQHRIGIFAKDDIKPGSELLFDYSYNKQHKEEFVANDRFGETTVKPKSKRATSQVPSYASSSSWSEDSDEEKRTKIDKRVKLKASRKQPKRGK